MKTSVVRLLTAFLFVVALLPPGQAEAQQTATGSVTGQVVDESTQRPLAGAAVTVVGTQLGTVTNTDGRYLITRVPVGSQQVQVSLIGHGEATQTVTIVMDQTATVNFSLSATAIALEQVVVTGTIGATRRAKLPIVVDQVRAEDMPVPAVSAGSVIQGKVAGATVISGTGRPGSAPTILLRGPTSINASGRSQEPLYIVDGVILSSSMVDFDALDIESVEVVKGAAGASLYGSRAQAGVVQIRTRRGTAIPTDQIRYTLRTEFGQNQLGSTPDDLFSTKHQYLIENGQFRVGSTPCDIMECTGVPVYAGQRAGPGEAASVWNSFVLEDYPGGAYDQVDRFFRDGNFMQTYVSAEGRAGATNFNASYSNMNEQGIMRGHDGFNRHNFRLNLDQSIREDVNVSASAFYSRSTQNAFPEGSGNPMFNLTRMPAGVNLFACEDDVSQECLNDPMNLRLGTDVFSREAANPVYELLNRKYIEERGRFLGSANLRYSPVSWLSLDGNVSFDRLDLLEDEHYPKGFRTISSSPGVNEGLVYKYNLRTEGLNGSLTATGTFQLTDAITNRTQLRYLIEDRESHTSWTQGDQLRVGDVYTFGNADASRLQAGSSLTTERSDGYFAITNFDIMDRYIIDALVRNDGSSLFGADQRRHWYYRVAGAWRLGEESWFSVPFIDEFKLRYSYGTAGGRPNFAAQYETFSVGSSGPTPVTLGNRDLKPEYTAEHEAGFDAAVWGNRITLALTYADATTTDQILSVPLPAYNGFGSQWQNAGTLESSTWEASADIRLLETQNLSWSAGVMYDRTTQKITELNVPAYTNGVSGQGMGAVFWTREGEALGTFYGTQTATNCGHLPTGVDCNLFAVNDDGYLVYVGAGGSLDNPQWGALATDASIRGVAPRWGVPIVGECTDRESGERTTYCQLGKSLPDYKLSFRSNLNWKGLSVYGLVDSWQGFHVYNQPLQWTIFKQLGGIMDQTGVAEARQKPIGYYDALYATSGLAPNSAFVEDGSFIKLREVSLRYRLDGSLLSGIPALNAFDGITLSLIGRNLYTWTDYRGYDPEVGRGGGATGSAALARVEGYQYPPFRTFTFAVDLNF